MRYRLHSGAGIGLTLCLHRVLPNSLRSSIPQIRDLEITPKHLDALVRGVRKLGYEVIPLDELLPRLASPGSGKPPAVITFDDGYLDNLEFALPVLEKLNAPFTIFATTGFIEGTTDAWWLELTKLVSLESAHRDIGDQYTKLYREACEAPEGPSSFARHRVAESKQTKDAPSARTFLDWSTLEILARSPLVTIGAHTVTHPRLSSLSHEEVERELIESANSLEHRLGIAVSHLAYPHGGPSDLPASIAPIARDAGFRTAVTTEPRLTRQRDLSYPHLLPRLMISGLHEDYGMLEDQFLGLGPWKNPAVRAEIRAMKSKFFSQGS